MPGPTERFRAFFETYASGAALRKRRKKLYDLRSSILHGSDLMQMDQHLAFGLDPPDFNEYELYSELSSITRLALRNWLKNPSAVIASEPNSVGRCVVVRRALGRLSTVAARLRKTVRRK